MVAEPVILDCWWEVVMATTQEVDDVEKTTREAQRADG